MHIDTEPSPYLFAIATTVQYNITMGKKGKKTKQTKPKIPKGEVRVATVEFGRLHDTLYRYIDSDEDRWRALSLRAVDEQENHGRGCFVAHGLDPKTGFIQADIKQMYASLEWWTLERCSSEPLPGYLPTDKDYEPGVFINLSNYDQKSNFMLVVTFISKDDWNISCGVMALYQGPNST